MHIEQLRDYCIKKKGVTETFPFNQDTLVFKVMGKMFALFPLEKWEAGEGWANLKCDSDYAQELRGEYESITAGWHMSKTHWNTIYIYKNEVPTKLVLKLIDQSYDLVVASLTKKLQAEMNSL